MSDTAVRVWTPDSWRDASATPPPVKPRPSRARATLQGWVNLCGFLGGVALALAALQFCLAAGPVGWIAALFVVPLAYGAGGVLGGLAGVALCGAGVLYGAWLLAHALI